MLNKSLTVILPVYNREASIARSTAEILELASELTRRFEIVIIDDGSTDSTYEVAADLARRFPQITLRRHRHRRGLGATLEAASRRAAAEVVIVHDGVSRINPDEVRRLWRDCVAVPRAAGAQAVQPSCGVAEFDMVRPAHAAMEAAHRRVLGFQLLTPGASRDAAFHHDGASLDRPHRHGQRERRASIGEIPPLPRPKFLTTLANFALGE